MDADFVSREALSQIKKNGVSQLLVGLELDGRHLQGSNDKYWPVIRDGQQVGKVTSAIHSPRLKKNIALAMMAREHTEMGTRATVTTADGMRNCKIVPKPFYDPKKSIAVMT